MELTVNKFLTNKRTCSHFKTWCGVAYLALLAVLFASTSL